MGNGNWLRQSRFERRLSQARLSRLTGIGQAVLSAYELQKVEITAEHERSIQRVLEELDRALRGRSTKDLFPKTRWSKDFGKGARSPRRLAISRPEIERFCGELQPQQRGNPSAPTAISLFSGCGGMTQGFVDAGFFVVGFAELSADARDIFSANFPASKVLGTDVRAISDLEAASWRRTFGEIDVIFGGPPCQGFSLTGKRDRWDPRNQLYKEFVRLVRIVKPRAFILENVRLLTSMKSPTGDSVQQMILEEFRSIGYTVSAKELNAQDFGVPQFRERVFFVGLRDARPISFPEPTHGESSPSLFGKCLAKRRTFRDAVGDLEPLESGEQSKRDPLHFAVTHPQHVIEMLRHVPEGGSAHDNPDPLLRPRSGYNTTYKRLRWDEPCSTVGTTFGMISGSRNVHPQYTRSLTIREAARCQSFPDYFRFFGAVGSIRTVIGNAVPPELARVLGTRLIGALGNSRPNFEEAL